MRLIVAAIGRLKDGPERQLFEKYRDRFEPLAKRLGLAPVVWHELGESRAADAAKRRHEEGAALLKLVRDAEMVIALDERGKHLTSEVFARTLAKTRDGGAKSTGILIGGPDGLSQEARETARLHIALGALTLPHALARIVLAEQLYRAGTILSGHPYHRA
ncbi:MAG: 23S rRNA (pseudouridine(1915)-N(3))-methyltransferase RlmH [Hyphomonadaceae bacterium]|jgi:23S rRNA (pseudouridine1915-N3)-methyltransferase|nr:23S rRNA (pseudouridine(1915)-N(3))-methyltransferase RlmH [Hyphomonadaceae bacterium]